MLGIDPKIRLVTLQNDPYTVVHWHPAERVYRYCLSLILHPDNLAIKLAFQLTIHPPKETRISVPTTSSPSTFATTVYPDESMLGS